MPRRSATGASGLTTSTAGACMATLATGEFGSSITHGQCLLLCIALCEASVLCACKSFM